MKARNFFAALAMSFVAAVACEEKLPDNSGNNNGDNTDTPPPAATELKISATFADGFTWSAGDAVAFLQIDEDPMKSNELTEGAQKAEFFLDEESGEGAYRVAYPYSDNLKYGVNTLTVPGNQVQQTAGEMNKANALFFSTADAQITADATADVQMKLVGSVVCFEVYGGAAGETVWSAGVSAVENHFSGELTVAADLSVTATPDYNLAHVDLTTPADASVAENAAQKLYLTVLPADNVANPTYFVMTDKGKYEFYTEAAETFSNGAVKTVKLNLSEADAFGASTEALSITVGETVYTEASTAETVEIPFEGAPVTFNIDAWVSGLDPVVACSISSSCETLPEPCSN